MSLLLDKLKQKKVLISDGAWGTMLQDKGLKPGDCPEAWNLSHPEEVKSIASAYVKAGSELILTNTFGGSRLKLASFGLESQTEALNRAGAEISRQAAGDAVLVLGSIGPTGHFLAPLGSISEKQMIDNFQIQIKGLIGGGVDAIIIETMSDPGEAVAAVKAAKGICDLPIIVTMTFEKGKHGYRTMMGTTVEQAVDTLSANQVDIMGTNCGNGIDQMIEIISEMRSFTDKPLLAHPNAGLPKLIDGKTVFDQTAEEMADLVPDLIAAGASIVGGCCGTGPEHIKAIATKIIALREKM